MSASTVVNLVLIGLTGLCFWFPYRCQNKKTAITASTIFILLILWTIVGDLAFVAMFIWLFVLAGQIVFLTYWVLRFYGKKRLGSISSVIIATAFLLIAASPWIEDWTFNKKDASELLEQQGIRLNDNFKLVKNESIGLFDYYETFTVEISASDFVRIETQVRNSRSFQGYVTDIPNWKHFDTLSYEIADMLVWEYYTKEKMNNGTYHFTLSLSKGKNELSYVGANE